MLKNPFPARAVFRILAVLLNVFIIAEVNYPVMTPQGKLSLFALLGVTLVFMKFPHSLRWMNVPGNRGITGAFIALASGCFGYVLLQSEPLFAGWWIEGQPLGNRAGAEQPLDFWVGLVGLIVVLEAARRAVGITLPLLSGLFLLYAAYGMNLPDWLFPHRGYDWQRIVSQAFLHSQGVFGIALSVMFTYVFLFVLFGTLLEQTGATDYLINFTRRIFHRSAGAAAKVAVLSSALMGSLSGSAVANTATTGTFTIPLMRSAGFTPENAGGIEAAASSGGALVPPIMGAGAYMMLEIIEPPVTYLEIIRAALIPAVLYYLALLLIVHFQAKRVGVAKPLPEAPPAPPTWAPGVVFIAAFVILLGLLVAGYTPFRAVSLSLGGILLVSAFRRETRVKMAGIVTAMEKAAHGGVALVAAAACVGIIVGIVTLTGIGSKLPAVLLPLAENNLILALLLLMVSTIILGMGVPSAVCYLLVATLVGPVLGELGIIPLAAHLFIFYFGMMSMVTPPVALAAYTAAAIAKAGVMETALAAFRFALIGFALPFAFVLRPELLLLSPHGAPDLSTIALNLGVTLLGIVALAGGITGYWFTRIPPLWRAVLLACAFVLLLSTAQASHIWPQLGVIGLIGGVAGQNWRAGRSMPESD